MVSRKSQSRSSSSSSSSSGSSGSDSSGSGSSSGSESSKSNASPKKDGKKASKVDKKQSIEKENDGGKVETKTAKANRKSRTPPAAYAANSNAKSAGRSQPTRRSRSPPPARAEREVDNRHRTSSSSRRPDRDDRPSGDVGRVKREPRASRSQSPPPSASKRPRHQRRSRSPPAEQSNRPQKSHQSSSRNMSPPRHSRHGERDREPRRDRDVKREDRRSRSPAVDDDVEVTRERQPKDRRRDQRREAETDRNRRVKDEPRSPERQPRRVKFDDNVERERADVDRKSQRSPVRQEGRRRRTPSPEESGPIKWGKDAPPEEDKPEEPPVEVEKPSFGLSGKLTADTNTFQGVVIKYNEPPEARKPKVRWRLYPFKGDEALKPLYVHRQSAYLIGRERRICDFPVDHPSCSKQHAVLQYRSIRYQRDDGSNGRRTRPYVIDLGSPNGTYLNGNRIDSARYYELHEKDVLKFGFSTREYVVLHENSAEEAAADNSDEEGLEPVAAAAE